MKYYNASIYFTYKGSPPDNRELEQEICEALEIETKLKVNNAHVELVDDDNIKDEPCVLTSPDKSSMPSSTDSKE